MLKSGERLDDLYPSSADIALQIIQSDEVFSFSLDAVLLAHFTYLPLRESGQVVDLCSGNGVVPLFLSQRTRAKLIGVEIQARLFDMAVRSVQHNQLNEQIEMIHGDLKGVASRVLGLERYDVVTCNPPYFVDVPASVKNAAEHFTIARHEVACTLEDVVRSASELLKQGGKFSIVHRPERLAELIVLMGQFRFEVKRLRFVHPKAHREANMVLLEAMKDGKPGVKVLPPLVVYEEDSRYTAELLQIMGAS